MTRNTSETKRVGEVDTRPSPDFEDPQRRLLASFPGTTLSLVDERPVLTGVDHYSLNNAGLAYIEVYFTFLTTNSNHAGRCSSQTRSTRNVPYMFLDFDIWKKHPREFRVQIRLGAGARLVATPAFGLRDIRMGKQCCTETPIKQQDMHPTPRWSGPPRLFAEEDTPVLES